MAVSFVWPQSLPQVPLRDGYAPDAGVLQARTPVDRGPAKTIYLGVRPRTIELSWLMTDSQLEALRVFDEETTKGARFGWPDPLSAVQIEVRFLRDQGGKAYSPVSLGGGFWNVSATLEVLP